MTERKYVNMKLHENTVDKLKVWYQNRVPAKEAAKAIDVSYQCVYIYYKGFESAGFKKISLAELAEVASA